MDVIAQETERAMSFHILKALLMYIKEISDLYVAGLAE
jgi:predicted DNA-binding protein